MRSLWYCLSFAGRVSVCSVCAMLLTFIVCVVGDVFGAIGWGIVHRNDSGASIFGFLLYCIAVSGVIGAACGAFTPKWSIEGKPRFVVLGAVCGITLVVLAAYLLGVLARLVQLDTFTFVVIYLHSQEESQVNSGEYIARHLTLLFGLPVGAFLGVKLGLRIYFKSIK